MAAPICPSPTSSSIGSSELGTSHCGLLISDFGLTGMPMRFARAACLRAVGAGSPGAAGTGVSDRSRLKTIAGGRGRGPEVRQLHLSSFTIHLPTQEFLHPRQPRFDCFRGRRERQPDVIAGAGIPSRTHSRRNPIRQLRGRIPGDPHFNASVRRLRHELVNRPAPKGGSNSHTLGIARTCYPSNHNHT